MFIRATATLCYFLFVLIIPPITTQAMTFDIPAGDSSALITALQIASNNPTQAHVINLAPDSFYTLTEVKSILDPTNGEAPGYGGQFGLPKIGGNITINGNNATIERPPSAPLFSFIFLKPGARLTINALRMQGGHNWDPVWEIEGTGGAIFSMGNLVINDSVVSNNQSRGGGAIISIENNVTISRSIFEFNRARIAGGAILFGFRYNQQMLITDSYLRNNRVGADDLLPHEWIDGGAIRTNNGHVRVENSTIADNTAINPHGHGWGGAIFFVGESVEVSNNSTITGNRANRFGGIAINASVVTRIRNLTISGNQADLDGGGLSVFGEQVSVSNTILTDNSPTNCWMENGSYLSLGGNIDSDGSCNFTATSDQSNIDPMLGTLAYNGGYTPTFALMPGSPAIDRAIAARCPLHDQRGIARYGTCDVGSFELSPTDGAPIRNRYSTSTPELMWIGTTIATGYQLQIAVTPNFIPAIISDNLISASATSYIPASPLPDGIWYWRLRARQSDGRWGAWSAPENFAIVTSGS
jgi:hypothetical protein